MKSYDVRIHPSAERDIDDSVAWIAEHHSWEKALEWLTALQAHIATLS